MTERPRFGLGVVVRHRDFGRGRVVAYDADRYVIQGYITRCYGSLTTFNVLFGHRASWFVGQGDKDA